MVIWTSLLKSETVRPSFTALSSEIAGDLAYLGWHHTSESVILAQRCSIVTADMAVSSLALLIIRPNLPNTSARSFNNFDE